MLRPFAAMLHSPSIARAAADLGAVLRFEGELSDHDRELVICVTAHERSCTFEWDAHSKLASQAGVNEEVIAAIRADEEVIGGREALLVRFARELLRAGEVSETTFDAVLSDLGEAGTVELTLVVCYYTMITLFMRACDIC